ncbi:hypothetical protein HK096_002497 [Nowakowskiella sp. JEL0078]|nr:hypothetical protein HK096_002497 [Nowakowskiella sp. JEL0078]
MKIRCKLLDSSAFGVLVESTDDISALKDCIKEKKKNDLAAIDPDKLLLVRVFETPSHDGGLPVGVPDDTDLVEVERAVLSARSSEYNVETARKSKDGTKPYKVRGWEFDGPEISAKVMNPSTMLMRYLTNDTEEECVDVLVIVPGNASVYTTREQIIKRETATTDLDGINVQLPHLDRKNILDDICYAFEDQERRFVLLSSPAGSGKTSVLNLLEAGKTKYKCFYLSCVRYEDLADVLYSELKAQSSYVIDLVQSSSSLPTDIDIVIMIDDAQVTYSNTGSWTHFIKNGPKFTPGNVKFVISATHMLNGGKESPLEFKNLYRISRDMFLLNEADSIKFMDSPLGLKDRFNFPSVKHLIILQSGGLVGALRVSVFALGSAFSKNDSPKEEQVLQLVLSKGFVDGMARVFGSEHSYPLEKEFVTFLEEIFTGGKRLAPRNLGEKDEKLFISLQKSGVLINRDDMIDFTSPLARRYFIRWLFPQRANEDPDSLHSLMEKCIRSMSASLLLMSTVPGAKFSKEATFQHLTMRGLAENTTPNCAICPELSKIYPDSNVPGGSIKGEIDFYLNGKLRWGIELLLNGSGIGEHLQRFSKKGKYEPLKVKDYVVVDFRENDTGEPTNIVLDSHRFTAFFKTGSYKSCRCIYGEEKEPFTLQLSG